MTARKSSCFFEEVYYSQLLNILAHEDRAPIVVSYRTFVYLFLVILEKSQIYLVILKAY